METMDNLVVVVVSSAVGALIAVLGTIPLTSARVLRAFVARFGRVDPELAPAIGTGGRVPKSPGRPGGVARGTDSSALEQRLVAEGLRMADHPGVIFKDGP